MFKKIYNLFKILRKLSISGAVETLDQLKPLPVSLKILFKVFSIGSNKNEKVLDTSPGERLCESLEDMGTTFIKLVQFLAKLCLTKKRKNLLWNNQGYLKNLKFIIKNVNREIIF